MSNIVLIIDRIKGHPAVILDVVKYLLAALVLFGLPIPPGVDIAIAGVILAVLTLVTKAATVGQAEHDRAMTEAAAPTGPAE